MIRTKQRGSVVDLDSRRTTRPLVHREKLVACQLYAFPLKRGDKRRPRIQRDAFALVPFLYRVLAPADIGRHFGEGVPAVKDVVKRAHVIQYAPDGLSDQAPPIIPMTASTPARTICPMGRSTTPVKFRAEMAKRLMSARIVAKYETKKQAADALGIGLDRYEKWESGRTPIPAQYVGPICALYGIDANYLYNIDPRPAVREQKKTG